VFIGSKIVYFENLEEKMKVKMFLCALMLMFVVAGCAGVQSTGTSSSSGSSEGLTKEQLKKMGVDENKGM
jgi:hypothetical protein